MNEIKPDCPPDGTESSLDDVHVVKAEEPKARPVTKEGTGAYRNLPCVCGSGKKFKKCCLH